MQMWWAYFGGDEALRLGGVAWLWKLQKALGGRAAARTSHERVHQRIHESYERVMNESTNDCTRATNEQRMSHERVMTEPTNEPQVAVYIRLGKQKLLGLTTASARSSLGTEPHNSGISSLSRRSRCGRP